MAKPINPLLPKQGRVSWPSHSILFSQNKVKPVSAETQVSLGSLHHGSSGIRAGPGNGHAPASQAFYKWRRKGLINGSGGATLLPWWDAPAEQQVTKGVIGHLGRQRRFSTFILLSPVIQRPQCSTETHASTRIPSPLSHPSTADLLAPSMLAKFTATASGSGQSSEVLRHGRSTKAHDQRAGDRLRILPGEEASGGT